MQCAYRVGKVGDVGEMVETDGKFFEVPEKEAMLVQRCEMSPREVDLSKEQAQKLMIELLDGDLLRVQQAFQPHGIWTPSQCLTWSMSKTAMSTHSPNMS